MIAFDIFNFQIESMGILLALAMFSIISYQDLKYRQINDIIWIFFGLAGIVLLVFNTELHENVSFFMMSLIIIPVSLLFWKIGLFGGADAFALSVLVLLVPQYSFANSSPFTIITNASLLAFVPLLANFFKNTLSIMKNKKIFDGYTASTSEKIIALFLGYKTKSPKFCFLMEKQVGKSKKFNFSLHHAEDSEFCNIQEVWVTPGIPFLLMIFGGFLIQLFYGDVILMFIGELFK